MKMNVVIYIDTTYWINKQTQFIEKFVDSYRLFVKPSDEFEKGLPLRCNSIQLRNFGK